MNNNKNIYRIIKPYQSDRVYEAQTTLHGANKCYNELKKSNVNSDSFTIMNLNDNSIYDFKINQKPQMVLKDNDKIKELLNNNGNNMQTGGDINEFKKILEDLSKRVSDIEKKIS
jgi:hypothetical protein